MQFPVPQRIVPIVAVAQTVVLHLLRSKPSVPDDCSDEWHDAEIYY